MANFLKPVYIDKNEGIGSITSRLDNTPEKQLALVFPPDSFIFKNVLEIQYLKREATRLNKDIIIITPDKGQEELARSFGLKVKTDLFEKPEETSFLEGFYQGEKGKTEDTTAEPQRVPVSVNAGSKEARHSEPTLRGASAGTTHSDHRAPGNEKTRSSLLSRLPTRGFSGYLYGGALLSFIVLLYVVSSVILSAEVVVKPKKEKVTIEENVKFVVDTQVDGEKNTVPLEVFTITKEKGGTFPATGEREGSSKSYGKVTILNGFSATPQTLVQRTRLLSKDNKLFRLTKKVDVPGYKTVNGAIVPGQLVADVEADEPGESFNIGPSLFTIPGFKGTPQFDKISAKSDESMKGGKTGKTKYVTKDDLTSAKDKIMTLIKNEVADDLKSNFPKEYGFFEKQTFKEVKDTVEVREGDTAENFSYKTKTTVVIFGYKKEMLEKYMELKVKQELTKNKIVLPERTQAAFSNITLTDSLTEVGTLLKGSVFLSYSFEEGWLKDVLGGKNESEIASFKNGYPEIDQLSVSIKPGGLPFIGSRIPRDKAKIKISIDYND